jgi:basic amino acid/polyamine antiporter, APA family
VRLSNIRKFLPAGKIDRHAIIIVLQLTRILSQVVEPIELSGSNPDPSQNAPAAAQEAVLPPSASKWHLLRVLGVWFGIAVAVGNTIAAGIVRTPGEIAQLLPDPVLFLAVWVVGGLYAICGASSLAELGAAIPRSGGQYNYSRRAMGEYAGFVVGWCDWLSACGAIAAVSIVVSEYTCKLFSLPSGIEKSIAVSTIIGFVILQWRGISWGSMAQMITAAMKSAAFIILALACFLLGPFLERTVSGAAPTVLHLPAGSLLATNFMLALQAVFYTMDGWNGVVYFGEEIKDPGRDVPRSMFGSVVAILGIYLALNAAVLFMMPLSEIAGNKFCLGTVSEKIFGVWGDPVIRAIMVVSLLSCVNAIQLFCSRVLYAMSSDGLFAAFASRVNKGGTPYAALALSAAIAIVFVVGSFEHVIGIVSFLFVVNYMMSYISLFVLRFRQPDMPRPYKAWGYPWTSALALAFSLAFLLGSVLTDHQNAPYALALLAASYPTFRLWKLFKGRTGQTGPGR